MTIILQRTLKGAIGCAGIGLHGGKRVNMMLHPAEAGTGIRFRRTDLGGAMVEAGIDNVDGSFMCTSIGDGNGASVATVEHLMASFLGLGIDNIRVEIDADEPPIGDGSALPFVGMIERAGVVEQSEDKRIYTPSRKIAYAENGVKVQAVPADKLQISLTVEYDHPLIKKQEIELVITEEVFKKEIAPAKTYCFDYEIEQLEKIGLAKGGSLENAIVIGEKDIHNKGIMTFEDEFVRHKVLDRRGDFRIPVEVGPNENHAVALRCRLNDKSYRRTLEEADTFADHVTSQGRLSSPQSWLSFRATPEPV